RTRGSAAAAAGAGGIGDDWRKTGNGAVRRRRAANRCGGDAGQRANPGGPGGRRGADRAARGNGIQPQRREHLRGELMKYRELGRTGFQVSDIGYGAWGIGGKQWLGGSDDESVTALRRAIEL